MIDVAVIKSHDGKAEERVNFADLYNTWQRTFELSSTYQVEFTMRYVNGFEYVFNLAQVQAEVLFMGQAYKIKDIEPVTNEQGVATKKITATNALIDKLKNLRVADDDKSDNSSSDSSSSDDSDDNKQPGTVIKPAPADPTYTLDTVMHQFFDKNNQGISYELHGSFTALTEKASGSCLDFLTSNLAGCGGYWIPDGNVLKIYDLNSLTHQTGETFRYLYDSPNVDIQQSTADLVNVVNVKAGKMEKTTTTSDSSGPVSQDAQGLISYARSWLGRPYILGGRTEAGSDCAGFVHFCYAKMGVDIGWTTYTQVGSFHQVGSAQTGDVGFYGSLSSPYHVCLFLDANTIIYEPQEGESCKEIPVGNYPPSWIGRNDQMASIMNGGGSAGSTSSSTEEFYQLNFQFKDQQSIDLYDEHVGEDQTLDTIYDQNQATQYLQSHLQVDPAATMTWTHKGKCPYQLGDSIHTYDPELNVDTDMIVFSVTINDYNQNNDATINFNNTGKAMNDINEAIRKQFRNINQQMVGISSSVQTATSGARYEDHFQGITTVTASDMEKVKVLTGGIQS